MFKLLEFLVVALILLAMVPRTFSSWSKLSFVFETLDQSISNQLNYTGDFTISPSGIELTSNQKDKTQFGSIGRVTYGQLIHLWDNATGNLADFTTSFTFVIDSLNRSFHADGVAFFLASEDLPFDKYQEGLGLGLVNKDQATNGSDYPFVAVEFDTFSNSELKDPPAEHVGIDISSMISKADTPWSSSILDGRTNQAWISYDSSSKNLSVTFTGFQGTQQLIQSLSYVVDLRKILPERVAIGFSAATGGYYEIHRLMAWNFSSSLQVPDANPPSPASVPTTGGSGHGAGNSTSSPPKPSTFTTNGGGSDDHSAGNGKNLKLRIGSSVAVVCVLVVVGGAGIYFWKKKGSKKEDVEHVSSLEVEFEQSAGPKRFSYDALAQATDNFAEERKLGQGGFGGVYQGFLLDLKLNVAVKKTSSESKQGVKEYASEVKIISRVRHRNLVRLIGWCHEKGELLLVYELMENGSLDHHLFRSENVLSWGLRYKIACGLASALLYLHEEWDQAVLHRDIKSSNVMLDSDFNAKLGDFGLAKIVDHGKGSATTVLAGTLGYMAPECFSTSKATTESDVYSFGIVCLEIACGRKPIDPSREEGQIRLEDWVWSLYGERKIMQALDPRLVDSDYVDAQAECLLILGLWCAHPDYCLRPSMKQATAFLSFEAPVPRLPFKFPVATYTTLEVSPEVSDIIGSSTSSTQAS